MSSPQHQYVRHKAVKGCNKVKQFKKKTTLISTGKGQQEMKANRNKKKRTA